MSNYESKEELYFTWWLDELKLNGYIDNWKYHPKPFALSDSVKIIWQKQLKTKVKKVPRTLMKGHNYQADFLIRWNNKAKNIFFGKDNTVNMIAYPFMAEYNSFHNYYRSIVDVKGTFNQNDAWRRFSIDQKWVWQRYKIYVQKVIPIKLFKSTFTPIRYLKTDKQTRHRKLAYTPVSLYQFINDN